MHLVYKCLKFRAMQNENTAVEMTLTEGGLCCQGKTAMAAFCCDILMFLKMLGVHKAFFHVCILRMQDTLEYPVLSSSDTSSVCCNHGIST